MLKKVQEKAVDLYRKSKLALEIMAILVILVTGVLIGQSEMIDEFKQPAKKAISYSAVSTAFNEYGEIVLLDKTNQGYKVLVVLDDSIATGIFNMMAKKMEASGAAQ